MPFFPLDELVPFPGRCINSTRASQGPKEPKESHYHRANTLQDCIDVCKERGKTKLIRGCEYEKKEERCGFHTGGDFNVVFGDGSDKDLTCILFRHKRNEGIFQQIYDDHIMKPKSKLIVC